ncbi:hypothetical protein [Herbaspirillum sp. NPDC101397]|uniref:hypothetical protein n=1 Tax=Herbaspirillum sp. NPDC101397 TaxID=3364006 RepID=UPI00383B37F3
MRERFNTVAVAIPAQIFYVRCHVSIDRQVPVMTDFAVRLLHLSGPMEVSAIREYFGFSAGQLRDLLDILREEGLVGEANGRISLTSYAESRFAVSEDGLPRFTKIAERQSRPIFELLSYTPLPKVLANNYWDNALELKWDENSDVAGKTIERAEAAFHKHFLDIERLEFEDEKRRAYSCYKVDDIRAGRPFSIPLPVHFDVDIEGNVEFEIDAQLELLPESLRSQVRTLTADRIATLSTHSDHLRTFVEYFNDELLARYLHKSTEDKNKGVVINADGKIGLRREPTIDFAKYVRDVHGQANGEVYEGGKSKAVLGALYMPKNQSRLLDELRKSFSSIKKSRNTGMPEAIFWVIPDSELWGRTSLVRDLINGIQGVFQDTFDSPKEITAIAPCHQSEHRDRLFKRAHHLIDAGFSRVILSPYQPKHQCVEVLLIPGVFGVATYHWKTPNATQYNVPFGFLTQSQAKLQKMAVFTMSTLTASLHKVSRGNSNTPDDRRFKLEDAVVSEFVFLDHYIGSSRAPIT